MIGTVKLTLLKDRTYHMRGESVGPFEYNRDCSNEVVSSEDMP